MLNKTWLRTTGLIASPNLDIGVYKWWIFLDIFNLHVETIYCCNVEIVFSNHNVSCDTIHMINSAERKAIVHRYCEKFNSHSSIHSLYFTMAMRQNSAWYQLSTLVGTLATTRVGRQTLLITGLLVRTLGLCVTGTLVDDVVLVDGFLVVTLCGMVSLCFHYRLNPKPCGSCCGQCEEVSKDQNIPNCWSLSAVFASMGSSILVSSDTTPRGSFLCPGRET
jgi:hypothetical protein